MSEPIDWPARVQRGLTETRERIERACKRAGRDVTGVRLLAVSKKHPAEAIAEAYACGQRDFGENYMQDLAAKADALGKLVEVRFRLIGHLQKNKAKDAARIGCAVDTLDSIELADTLARRAVLLRRRMDVMIEVNVDGEPQKAGVLPADVERIAEHVRSCSALSLAGLLCIPRADDDLERMRPAFAALRELGARIGTRELSMGMSDDLEVAIEEGSTMVRVGTAIFGPRNN